MNGGWLIVLYVAALALMLVLTWPLWALLTAIAYAIFQGF